MIKVRDVGQLDNGFMTYLVMVLPWLQQPGYGPLFLVSFLAATLLPLGSEWLLALMLVNGADPVGSVLTATTGNLLGACTTWMVGRYGGDWLITRLFRISDQQQQRAERWYQRYGSYSLFFSWLPIVGDPLCLVGGLLKISLPVFILLAGTGKLARYAAVTWLTLQVAGA